MSEIQKPGETPQGPGEYIQRGPRGGEVSNPRVVTITPDDGHLPPLPVPNNTWERISQPRRKR
jgi:hypothetical protein